MLGSHLARGLPTRFPPSARPSAIQQHNTDFLQPPSVSVPTCQRPFHWPTNGWGTGKPALRSSCFHALCPDLGPLPTPVCSYLPTRTGPFSSFFAGYAVGVHPCCDNHRTVLGEAHRQSRGRCSGTARCSSPGRPRPNKRSRALQHGELRCFGSHSTPGRRNTRNAQRVPAAEQITLTAARLTIMRLQCSMH